MGRSPISWVSGSWSSSCVGSLTLRTGLDYRVYRWPLPKSYYQSHRQSLCSKVPYHSGCHCVVRLVKVTMIVSSPRPIPPCSISCTLARLAVLPCLARCQSVMRSLMNLIFDRIRPPRIAIVMHRPGGTVGSGQCHCRRSHDSARQHAQISPTLSLSLSGCRNRHYPDPCFTSAHPPGAHAWAPHSLFSHPLVLAYSVSTIQGTVLVVFARTPDH